jgi:hypothetical protein
MTKGGRTKGEMEQANEMITSIQCVTLNVVVLGKIDPRFHVCQGFQQVLPPTFIEASQSTLSFIIVR